MPSPTERGVIWTGSDDGRIHVTRDGGASWTSVEGRLRGAPKHAYVPHIHVSNHRAGTAFVVLDAHRDGDFETYVWRLDDYGALVHRDADELREGAGARVEVDRVWMPKDRLAKIASDHLPLVADLRIRF